MVSEEEKLREELRAIKEVLAAQENRVETEDYNNYNELHIDVCVPQKFNFLESMGKDSLERRKELIQRDLRELQELDYDESEGEFRIHTEYHRGRRDTEGDDNE